MSDHRTAAIIIVVALMTWLARGLPYLVFGNRKLPKMVNYLGTVLPASIMIILVVYCLRNTIFTKYPFGLAEVISVLMVIGLHLWKKNTFVSILVGTACYMMLIRTVFQV